MDLKHLDFLNGYIILKAVKNIKNKSQKTWFKGEIDMDVNEYKEWFSNEVIKMCGHRVSWDCNEQDFYCVKCGKIFP